MGVIPRLWKQCENSKSNLFCEILTVRIKQTKMIFSLLGLILLQSVGAKICWKECASDTSALQNVNIEGCRRRASYPHRQRFRCEGTEGPPCIVERASTVHLDVAWQNPGVTNMTQSTVWVSGWGIEIPWVGMETEGCPFGSWYWMSSICAGTTEQVLLPNSHPGDVSSRKVRSQVEVLRQRLAGQRD